MVPALSIHELKKEVKKSYLEKNAIIGVMLGRYNIPKIQEAIDESYTYWNLNSDKDFNIYWVGYGKNWGDGTKNQIILKSANENDGAYFDIKKFVEFKSYIEKSYKIEYEDKFQLILCNVRDGEIFFNENIIFELEDKNISSTVNIRFIMENIIKLCKYQYSIDSMKKTEKFKNFERKIEESLGNKIIQYINIGGQINVASNNATIRPTYNRYDDKYGLTKIIEDLKSKDISSLSKEDSEILEECIELIKQ